MASNSDDHVTASGSALVSAEMVISCAAPARSSAPLSHAKLGEAAAAGGFVVGPVSTGTLTGAFWVVIARSLVDDFEGHECRTDQASRRT